MSKESGKANVAALRAGLARTWVAVMVGLVACGGHCQGLDFEESGKGWVVQGAARWSSEQPAQGSQCLVLEAGKEGVWAISEALPGVNAGEAFELSFAVRPVSGAPELLLALVAQPAAPQGTALWRETISGGGRWSRRSLTVICGLQGARLGLGVAAGSGSVAVDDVRISPARLVAAGRKVPADRQPGYGEPLPEGWQPEGNLDLVVRSFMGEESAHIRSGMLELNPVQEVSVNRGERTGMYLDVLNRSRSASTLRAEVQGPRGWRTENWERQIPGLETVSVNLPLQAMRAGETQVKVVFSSGNDRRAMPLKVHARRQFPALGAYWSDAATIPDELERLPVQFHHLFAAPESAAEGLERLEGEDWDVGLSLECGIRQGLDALSALPGETVGRLASLGCGDPDATLDSAKEFYAAARAMNESAVIPGRVFALQAGPSGLTGGDDLREALSEGSARWADALMVRLPALPGSAVLRQAGEGATCPALDQFDRAWDPSGLRAELSGADAALPLLALIHGTGTGASGLDAVLLSRIITQVAAVGANGIALPGIAPEPGGIGLLRHDGAPDETMLNLVDEMARELAGATPLSPPAASDVAAQEPGRPVVLRSFIRGDEGIVVLWNNSRQRQGVAVDVRCRPVQVRILRISFPGEVFQREFDGSFDWDPVARKWGQPAVYLDIEPLQTVVVALKLRGAHNAWLREVGPQPPKDQSPGPGSLKAIEEHGFRDQ